MSLRAIRRLQESRERATLPKEDEEDEDDEDEEKEVAKSKRKPVFLASFDDDDEDDSSSEEDDSLKESSNEKEKETVDANDPPIETSANETKTSKAVASAAKSSNAKPGNLKVAEPDDDDDDDDLDVILAEFRSLKNDDGQEAVAEVDVQYSCFRIITDGMDVRDLDIDFVIRTTLSGNVTEAPSASRRGRRSRQNLFGNPRDDWIRPPHYVGGGIGMTTYDVSPRPIPWPYNNSNNNNNTASNDGSSPSRWFRFQCSDSYIKDCNDYIQIQQSGDVNALALFLSHHPYVTDGLLQLAMVLYQTNQNQEGLLLIRRTLWIYECSSLPGFTPQDGATCLMDYHQLENSPFFLALFRLMQVSSIAGCMRTALAVSRYLLSLDPLRDPVGVLLILDSYALSCNTATQSKWLVDLVESGKVQVFHRDTSTATENSEPGVEYKADLLDLPNFAYSYAMALFHLHELDHPPSITNDVTWLERAHLALQSAIRKFPTIVEMLLDKNEVDLRGRSVVADWSTVMAYLQKLAAAYLTAGMGSVDADVRDATMNACDVMIRIFVDRNYKIWGRETILRWLYRNVDVLKSFHETSAEQQLLVTMPSPALMRYAPTDPEDYADRIRTFPPEANPLDPNALVPALAMNANRGRFLQRRQQQQQQGIDEDDAWAMAERQQFAGQIYIGGPPTNVVDPDLPLLELFWRSALPWNRVDGVPPPRR